MNGHYEAAQICRNGHVISSYYDRYPDHRQSFCDECGAATITQCDGCKTAIRGSYVYPGPVPGSEYSLPSYCHACGQPYPWTASKIETAREVIEELDGLDPEDRRVLKENLTDLVTAGPKTEMAGLRFKRLMRKLGTGSYNVLKKVLTDLLSETVKKTVLEP